MNKNLLVKIMKDRKVFKIYLFGMAFIFLLCLIYGFVRKPGFEKASQIYPYREVTNAKVIVASAITAILWPVLLVFVVLGKILELFGTTGSGYGPVLH